MPLFRLSHMKYYTYFEPMANEKKKFRNRIQLRVLKVSWLYLKGHLIVYIYSAIEHNELKASKYRYA